MLGGCINFILLLLWQHHKFRNLNNTIFYSLFSISEYQWCGTDLIRLRLVYRQGVVFLEASGENPYPCLFQLLVAARIPWLMASSLHLQSQPHQLSPFYAAISLLLPTPTLEDPFDYIVPIQTIQDNLCIWGHFITNLYSSCNLTYSQLPRIRMWTTLRTIILPTTDNYRCKQCLVYSNGDKVGYVISIVILIAYAFWIIVEKSNLV